MQNLVNLANLEQYSENSRLITHNNHDLKTIEFNDLKKSTDGIPIMCKYNEDNKLEISFNKNEHVLLIGNTGSGKTQGHLIPFINIKARQKIKPHMFITDPKHEIYKNTASLLKDEGYAIKVLNFKDSDNSDYYNPLTPIYKMYQKLLVFEAKIEYYREYTKNLLNTNSRKKIHNLVEEEKKLISYKKKLIKKIDNEISKVVTTTISIDRLSDPYWETISRDLLSAFIYAMLEDSKKGTKKGLITEKTFSFKTILDIFSRVSSQYVDTTTPISYFSRRSSHSKALKYATSSILCNAPNTARCIFSTFKSKMRCYEDPNANTITSCNSIDLNKLFDKDKPIALFVIFNEANSSAYAAIQQIIISIYEFLIIKADESENNCLANDFFFLLDEFANFPKIPDLKNYISLSRSKKIWFYLIIQDLKQLENVYARDVSQIIQANTNIHIFISSNDLSTKQKICDECGQKKIFSVNNYHIGNGVRLENFQTETTNLITNSTLSNMKTAECLIVRSNFNGALLSKMEFAYKIKEFKTSLTNIKNYKSNIDPYDDAYDYF